MPTMVTLAKASELTGVKYSALRRWIKSGEFTYYRMAGSKYLIILRKIGTRKLSTRRKKPLLPSMKITHTRKLSTIRIHLVYRVVTKRRHKIG